MFFVTYEPMRVTVDAFKFSAGLSYISWRIEMLGLCFDLNLTLSKDDPLELWSITVLNKTLHY